jgi:predicted RNA-binding protein associated with RNAse of E/G family
MAVLKPAITVIKRNVAGQVVIQYSARVLHRRSNEVVLEARFNHADTPILNEILKSNDRFVEIYYTNRWYNIFAVHDRDDDRIKGWYCNVGRPAILESGSRISYVDLALDLWVAPDGTQTVLDEDEFAALDLDAKTRRQARTALRELQQLFVDHKNPDLS